MSTRETTPFGSADLLPVSVMSSASGASPILTQATGNELDFYMVVPRYNFSMKPAHYSKYYTHSEFLWRLAVDPRSHGTSVGIRIECGGPVDKKKTSWSCCARLMVMLVHPKRWASIGISLPTQDGDVLSNSIPAPVSQPPPETSAAPDLDSQAPADAVPEPVQAQAPDIDPPKKESESGPANLPVVATAETAPPVLETQPASAELPKISETGVASPCDPLSGQETQPLGKESSQSAAGEPISEAAAAITIAPAEPAPATSETQPVSDAGEASDEPSSFGSTQPSAALPVEPSQSDAAEESQPDAKFQAPQPEEEYIPRDLQVTNSHTYSSTEYSLSYGEEEFAPFALLQPGMFSDDDMNIVIRVKILANDYYNPNRGNAGSEVASVYGSSNAPPPPPTIIPMVTSVSSSVVPSLVCTPPEPLTLELTCRRALVQQIVDLDKKIESVSSDIAGEILKKEIEVLNEGLEQLSSAIQSPKKTPKNIKGALASLLSRRKPRGGPAGNSN